MRQTSLKMVHELAKADPRVVFIGSDLGPDTLVEMRDEFPDRFFMEGISEQNVIGMAAGMALDGCIPYVNTIATFLTRRCYEQVAVDLCLHDLPVRLIASGGGVVYAPLGPTHLAIEDIAIMRALPNMTVVAVADAEEMRRLMWATLDWPHPIYIRLAKGGDPVVTSPDDGFTLGKAILKRRLGDVLLVSTGVMLGPCLDAADLLAAEGIACGVLHMHTVKPIDADALAELAAKVRLIVTVEEHVLTGGLGGAVLETLADRLPGRIPPLRRLGIPDAFPTKYGSQQEQHKLYGLTASAIAEAVRAASSHGTAP
jgi:transketolase